MNVLLLGAAYAASKIFQGAKTAKSLDFSPIGIKYDKEKKALRVIIEASNPTNGALNIDSIFLTVYADKSKLGTIESTEAIKIEPLKSKDIAFNIKFAIGGLLLFIAKAVTSKSLDKVQFLGVAKVSGITLPINKELPVNIGTKKPNGKPDDKNKGGN